MVDDDSFLVQELPCFLYYSLLVSYSWNGAYPVFLEDLMEVDELDIFLFQGVESFLHHGPLVE